MIVLANEEFATGLRLAGVKKSFYISDKEQALSHLKDIDSKEFIIATQDIIELVPEINEFPNLITFPKTIKDFSNIDDLKSITKAAIGAEVQL